MMAAILNSAMLDSDTAILDSDTLLSSLRFTQKHSHSTLTLTQTNSIWLKLIHSDSTWWWQPSWILPCWIQPSWIQTPCYLLSDSLKNTLTPLWLWLKLQSDSNSFILTQLDDGSHLEFCHLGFSHFLHSQTHSDSRLEFPTICTKKTSLIHSDSTWWWQPSWILPCWIQTLPSWIQTPCYLLSDSLKNTLTPLWLWLKLIQSDSNSFILTQLDDGSHLEFCQTLPSWIQPPCFSLKFTQKHFLHWLWLKLIQSDSNSFILTQLDDGSHLEFWHSSWIQTPCYLLSDSLKNTLTPLWLWLKLIQSDSNSFILTQLDDGSHLESWIWPSWIQPS